MSSSAPNAATPWAPFTPAQIADVLASASARWWLSGGVALDHWLGRATRVRPNADVSTTTQDLAPLVAGLPAHLSAWVLVGGDIIPFRDAPEGEDLQPVDIFDDVQGAWVLRVNVEDGTNDVWMYRRDPRLQLPWDRAVVDVDGIPTGAPEVQLVWKALRPRPEDDLDKDAVLPQLSDEARAWWERAILTTHPHSTWSIHVRSPMFPAKASWNRPSR
ncbi:hypothetical protein LG299_09530 [Microbacterium lacus]|uniref:hypothetical protein n=1 Tax=Microbacterium lacus TaxID=415217 RepID=UPI00384AC28A